MEDPKKVIVFFGGNSSVAGGSLLCVCVSGGGGGQFYGVGVGVREFSGMAMQFSQNLKNKGLHTTMSVRTAHLFFPPVIHDAVEIPQWFVPVEGVLSETKQPPGETGTSSHVGIQDNVVFAGCKINEDTVDSRYMYLETRLSRITAYLEVKILSLP